MDFELRYLLEGIYLSDRGNNELPLDGRLWTHRTPFQEGCHPELEESILLRDVGIRKYQMLIGMAKWACTIGRLDIAFALSSLSRLLAAPRQHHLNRRYIYLATSKES
jgi:hypothetical protein